MNPNRSYRGLLSGGRSGDIMAGEQTFKAVVNGTVDHRAYSMDITGANYNHFLGKKIGDSVDGMFVGEGDQTLTGYKLQITGGSDVTGRPMRPDLDGAGVKSVLVSPRSWIQGQEIRQEECKRIRLQVRRNSPKKEPSRQCH